jgi:hypothetical protein
VPAVASAGLPVLLMTASPLGDDGARSFQYHHCLQPRRQFARGGQPVGLYGGDAGAQQARRFQRMRRQHHRGRAMRQRRLQRHVARQQVERIGVGQQGAAAADGAPANRAARAVPSPVPPPAWQG